MLGPPNIQSVVVISCYNSCLSQGQILEGLNLGWAGLADLSQGQILGGESWEGLGLTGLEVGGETFNLRC